MTTTDSAAPIAAVGRADTRGRLRLTLAIVGIGLPIWCVYAWIALSYESYGEDLTLAAEAEAARWLMVAAVTAVLAPVLALLLGGRRRWVVALVLGALFAGVAGLAITELNGTERISETLCRETDGDVRDCT